MRKKIYVILAGILIINSLLVGCTNKPEVKIEEEKKFTVEIIEAIVDDIIIDTNISGTFKASEEVDVVPKVMGKVSALPISEGEVVKKGDILFTLDSTNAQSAVRNATAAIENAKTAVETAKISIQRNQEQYDMAVLNYERSKQLYEAGAIPLMQLEQAELAATPLGVELAKTQFYQAQLAVDNASAALSDANIALSDFTIVAPINGTITDINLTQGNVFTGGPAIRISNLSDLVMKVDVSENLIKYFNVNETMDIKVKSADNIVVTGKIKQILPPTMGSLTYPVEILVENPPIEIKAGMFAEIKITTESRKQVIAIPSQTVVVKDGSTVVFAINGERVKIVTVKTGLDNGNLVEILEGINVGDRVVTKGQNFLENDVLINIVKQGE